MEGASMLQKQVTFILEYQEGIQAWHGKRPLQLCHVKMNVETTQADQLEANVDSSRNSIMCSEKRNQQLPNPWAGEEPEKNLSHRHPLLQET
uniref:Uncharacterized protein n=1 Tax=Sphaerodactylus townsendi TaxID=933632 RepID=A0ACB8EY21_9SAUR